MTEREIRQAALACQQCSTALVWYSVCWCCLPVPFALLYFGFFATHLVNARNTVRFPGLIPFVLATWCLPVVGRFLPALFPDRPALAFIFPCGVGAMLLALFVLILQWRCWLHGPLYVQAVRLFERVLLWLIFPWVALTGMFMAMNGFPQKHGRMYEWYIVFIGWYVVVPWVSSTLVAWSFAQLTHAWRELLEPLALAPLKQEETGKRAQDAQEP
ncbi:MAG: hypothetical protein KIS92_15030 [Planctomycetota bacterium]|nr:hypothetical protein [Planctomycetota bacterium]